MSHSAHPLRHISIRVPWHDSAWNGTICRDPKLNENWVRGHEGSKSATSVWSRQYSILRTDGTALFRDVSVVTSYHVLDPVLRTDSRS
jgi:hypothetical protein